MTSHYPDLGSACDNFLVESNFPDLGSDVSSVWNFCVRFWDVHLQEISGSVTKCWLFSQAKIFVVIRTVTWLGQFLIVYSLMWCNRYYLISCDRNSVWSVFIKQRNSHFEKFYCRFCHKKFHTKLYMNNRILSSGFTSRVLVHHDRKSRAQNYFHCNSGRKHSRGFDTYSSSTLLRDM